MDLQEKLKEINDQIKIIEDALESNKILLKRFNKDKKAYLKLIEKAKALENGN